jgi:hypothetical protein
VISRKLLLFIPSIPTFLLLSLLHLVSPDLPLQRAVDLAMQGRSSGAIVVVEVTSGKLLAARNLEVAAGVSLADDTSTRYDTEGTFNALCFREHFAFHCRTRRSSGG